MVDIIRRMEREIQQMQDDDESSPYYSLSYNPDNIYIWSANIHCLPDIRHEGKNYNIEIICPPSYPFKPPIVKFLDPVECLCVSNATGLLRLDILGKEWTPSLTIRKLMLSICSVLTDNEPARRSPRNLSY